MRNQHQADRQHPDTNDRKKPEQAADDAENAQGQPPPAPRGMTRPADGPPQVDLLFQPIERAIEQVAWWVVPIVYHTKQSLRMPRCSRDACCVVYAIGLFTLAQWLSRNRTGQRKDSTEYFLASKNLPWWQSATR
jgi:hypothetical protein